MKNKKFWIIVAVVLIVLLAFGLRSYAADHLHIDHDETTYLIAAYQYTNFIQTDQLNWLAWNKTNFEHPVLSKIIFGIALLPHTPIGKIQQSDFIDGTPLQENQAAEYGKAARNVSVVFGSLAVLILALLNPLAGLFLAVDTLAIKYTSEIYLEALPMLTSLIAVIAYSKYYSILTRSPEKRKKAYLWLVISGITLGMTAASKYIYCVAGLAIALHWLIAVLRKKVPVRSLLILLGWGIFSILMFFVFDPYLWVHTVERLTKTINYHMRFQASDFVKGASYPFYQPINWLFSPFASYRPLHDPYANDALLFSIDTLIFVLAVIGLPRTIKREPVFFLWLVIGIVVLCFWGSKWAQYTLVVLAPWCFAAAQGLLTLYDLVVHKLLRKPVSVSKNS